jgi:uncharacterized protein (TIGR02265 family)
MNLLAAAPTHRRARTVAKVRRPLSPRAEEAYTSCMAARFTAQGSMFEGLFVHALDVPDDFAAQLKGAGFDLADRQPSYDMDVWIACLDLASARLHGELPRYEAWRRLGREFVEGYFETMVGRLIAVTIPLMDAERFVARIPQYVRTGVGGTLTEVQQVGRGQAQVTLRGPHEGAAWVLTGVLEVCFERLERSATFAPESLGGVDSRIALTWDDEAQAAAPRSSERQSPPLTNGG